MIYAVNTSLSAVLAEECGYIGGIKALILNLETIQFLCFYDTLSVYRLYNFILSMLGHVLGR